MERVDGDKEKEERYLGGEDWSLNSQDSGV